VRNRYWPGRNDATVLYIILRLKTGKLSTDVARVTMYKQHTFIVTYAKHTLFLYIYIDFSFKNIDNNFLNFRVELIVRAFESPFSHAVVQHNLRRIGLLRSYIVMRDNLKEILKNCRVYDILLC